MSTSENALDMLLCFVGLVLPCRGLALLCCGGRVLSCFDRIRFDSLVTPNIGATILLQIGARWSQLTSS